MSNMLFGGSGQSMCFPPSGFWSVSHIVGFMTECVQDELKQMRGCCAAHWQTRRARAVPACQAVETRRLLRLASRGLLDNTRVVHKTYEGISEPTAQCQAYYLQVQSHGPSLPQLQIRSSLSTPSPAHPHASSAHLGQRGTQGLTLIARRESDALYQSLIRHV